MRSDRRKNNPSSQPKVGQTCAGKCRRNREGNQMATPKRIADKALSTLDHAPVSSRMLNARHFAEDEEWVGVSTIEHQWFTNGARIANSRRARITNHVSSRYRLRTNNENTIDETRSYHRRLFRN